MDDLSRRDADDIMVIFRRIELMLRPAWIALRLRLGDGIRSMMVPIG